MQPFFSERKNKSKFRLLISALRDEQYFVVVVVVFERLSAFIAKVFCQAKQVVDNSVQDEIHVTPTLAWLTANQNQDGSFTEYNYVNHGPLMVSVETFSAKT